jgi:site-specific DNA-adenine methylase
MSAVFYFAHTGSKRSEFKYIEDLLKKEKYNKFVEPFCGSFAISFLNYSKNGKQCDYYLNDNNTELIEFLKDVQRNSSKKYFDTCSQIVNSPVFNKEVHTQQLAKNKNPNSSFDYFYKNKIRMTCAKAAKKPRGVYELDYKKYSHIDKFLSGCIITSNDYTLIFEKFKNDTESLLFLDPPTISECKGIQPQVRINEKIVSVVDGTYIYIHILQFLRECRCSVVMLLHHCSLLEYIFKDYILRIYESGNRKLRTKSQEKYIIVLKKSA